jgi:hypothetical protein
MILMKNYSSQPHIDYDIPTSLPNLYSEAVEDKNFTKIKVDLFANTIKKNLESFIKAKDEL